MKINRGDKVVATRSYRSYVDGRLQITAGKTYKVKSVEKKGDLNWVNLYKDDVGSETNGFPEFYFIDEDEFEEEMQATDLEMDEMEAIDNEC